MLRPSSGSSRCSVISTRKCSCSLWGIGRSIDGSWSVVSAGGDHDARGLVTGVPGAAQLAAADADLIAGGQCQLVLVEDHVHNAVRHVERVLEHADRELLERLELVYDHLGPDALLVFDSLWGHLDHGSDRTRGDGVSASSALTICLIRTYQCGCSRRVGVQLWGRSAHGPHYRPLALRRDCRDVALSGGDRGFPPHTGGKYGHPRAAAALSFPTCKQTADRQPRTARAERHPRALPGVQRFDL